MLICDHCAKVISGKYHCPTVAFDFPAQIAIDVGRPVLCGDCYIKRQKAQENFDRQYFALYISHNGIKFKGEK